MLGSSGPSYLCKGKTFHILLGYFFHQGKELVIKSMKQIVTKCTDSPEDADQVLHGKSKSYTRPEYKEVAEYYKEKCFNWHETKVEISHACCKCRRA